MKSHCATALVLACLIVSVSSAEPVTLDDFATLDAWGAIASDGVKATISPVEGPHGRALRLDFDFERGAGFCVVRRNVSLDLPKNYRFSFGVRGETPPNNLEFKLVDPSGQNVWWVNQRAFEFPREWRTVMYKARQFRFAWGPSGGAPLDKVGAIELAVSASSGGKGSVWIDQLVFEALPEPEPVSHTPLVFCSSSRAAESQPSALDDSGRLNWISAENDEHPWLRIDFQQVKEGKLTFFLAPRIETD